ncbi:MAG TPA: polysaccharide biosynthesis/export family protein [Pyrinomonadaceae bacterium]|jgi:polysaccharide export outer membrane protein
MKFRILVLLLALVCFAAPLLSSAQEQGSSGAGQGGSQGGAAVLTASSVDSQGIRKYLLGPGDTVDIRVFGQSDMNWTGEVDGDGNISSLPFIETPIRAQCRTEKEVQADVKLAYSKLLRSPQVSVRTTGRNSRPPAIVLGAVPTPARVQMQRRVRLNEVIAVSGGYTERANGDIQVLHTEPVMCPEPGEVVEPLTTDSGLAANTLKIYKISDLVAGKPEANPVIRPGDVVNVMEAKPIYITGSVPSPQPLFLRNGMTLTKVLAMVGGVTGDAKTNDVRIYRTRPDSNEQEIIRADLGAIKKKQKEDIVLQPYDVIEVPKASDWSPGRLLTGLAKGLLGGVSGLPIQAIQYKVIY